MTLEEAIATYERYVLEAKKEKLNETYRYYTQLVNWLRELQERRKKPEIIRCSECTYFKDRAVTVGYCEKKMMYQYKDYFCKDAERRIK